MKFSNPIARFYCAFLLLLAPLSGAAESGGRVVRFLHYGAPPDLALDSVWLCAEGVEPVKVKLDRHNFTPPQDIPDGVRNFRITVEEPAGESPFPVDAPALTIPPDWADTLVILIHNGANPGLPIKIFPINASDNVFAPGETYWVNLSKVILGGRLGKQVVRLDPGQTLLTKSPGKEIEYEAALDFILPGETSPRALIRQMWQNDSLGKQVVLFLPKPRPQLAGYFVMPIRDAPEPLPKR